MIEIITDHRSRNAFLFRTLHKVSMSTVNHLVFGDNSLQIYFVRRRVFLPLQKSYQRLPNLTGTIVALCVDCEDGS